MTNTPLSIKVLQCVLDSRGWTQNDLADRAGVHRSIVSMQLSRQRAIRDDHLVAYLSALDRHERQVLLAAWLRDSLGADVIRDVLHVEANRVREEVAEWSPLLNEEQNRMLKWWSAQLARDPELAEIFRRITLKAGYPQ